MNVKNQREQKNAGKSDKQTMEIILNGMKEAVPSGISVLELLKIIGEKDRHAIVELNNKYIPPNEYNETRLLNGDKAEIINPDFGG